MSPLFQLFTYLIVDSFIFPGGASSLQCKNENGNSVDWFIVYKLPLDYHANDGTTYKYITSGSASTQEWIQSSVSIASEESLVGRTLSPIYSNNTENILVIYNDQYGDKVSFSHGHTKGIVLANDKGGVWIIHSVPRFPPVEGKYSYPKTGHRNGQSMLCITLSKDQIDILGKIFLYNWPYFRKVQMSDTMKDLYPNLASAVRGATIKHAPWQMLFNIKSADGKEFTYFAKSKNMHKDLYEWVAEQFQVDILAETWRNELVPLPSTCATYKVLNVESIKFQNESIQFSSDKDHSKWAISKNSEKPWICIGDINRTLHQKKRGGGTICFEDSAIWKEYKDIIGQTSSCPQLHSKRH